MTGQVMQRPQLLGMGRSPKTVLLRRLEAALWNYGAREEIRWELQQLGMTMQKIRNFEARTRRRIADERNAAATTVSRSPNSAEEIIMTTQTTTRLTTTQEAEIRERAQEASPGCWGSSRDLAGIYTIHANTRVTRQGFVSDGVIAVMADKPGEEGQTYCNASFIAYAPKDVRALLAELDAVRGERDAALEGE